MNAFSLVLFYTILITIPGNLCGSNDTDLIDIGEDLYISTPKHIIEEGYPIEIHKVKTEDGYILEMHRIPYGLKNGTSQDKPVVYLQHGFLASSADWVLAGTQRALGYRLADLGYDVWMGNARGNIYSRRHVDKSPETEEFWDFSWHEIAIYDLPAMIDYALAMSGQRKLFYIGHSQGTTVFYVLCSTKPEYNDKIRTMVSLAPAAYMSNIASPFLRILARYYREIAFIFRTTGVTEFMPARSISARSIDLFCKYNQFTQFLCTNLIYLLFGFDEKEQYNELMPFILAHTPAGSSVKQVFHYLQIINSGHFCQYDYNLIMNIAKYQSIHPPKYNLSKVRAPVSLFYSHNDWLSAEIDVLKLHQELGNAVGFHLVADPEFNHLDYIWAKNVDKLIHQSVFKILQKY